MRFAKVLLVVAGLFGAAGVAGSAWAAHGAGGNDLVIASQFLLLHAVALVGLQALRPPAVIAGAVLAVGTVLFSGDLARHGLSGVSLFPLAAPTGGLLMIGGWLLVAATALVRLLSRQDLVRP